MRLKRLVGVMFLVSPILLSGCGSSSNSSSGSGENAHEINVAPSLGKISAATVRLYQRDGTSLLATSEIGSDGRVLVSYSGSYDGPVIVVVSGDDDATYYDEASGTEIAFAQGKLLRSIVPSGTTETAVTMLTEVAYQLSLTNGIELTDESVAQLNELVRLALTPELTSILSPPILFDSSTTSGDLGNDESGRYALRLAALAQLGVADITPALSIAEQLSQDFADGVLDGQSGSAAIAGLLYNSGSLASDLSAHLTTLATAYGTAALQSALSAYTSISINIDLSDLLPDSGNESLPSFVAGQTVMMEYCCSTAGSPYSNEEQVQFAFSSNGALMLTEQSTEIASSFTIRGSEYIWVDTDNNLEYALSILNSEIHEVNVQGVGGTPFYGQFSPVDEPGEVTLETDGDGTALAGLSGATGTVGSTTYTFTGHPVEGSALYFYTPLTDSGLFTAYNGTDAITRWTINGFANSVGNVECAVNGSLPYISLTLNGVPHLAEECVIEILSVSTTEVEGRFAAVLNGLGTVTNGYFRYEVPETAPVGGLGDDEYGYSMDVDGTEVTDNDVLPLDGFDRQVADFLTLGDTPFFQIRMIPEGVSGSYICGEGPNSFRLVSMGYQGYSTDNATHPGSCSVEVTYASGIYSGTFNGTLYNSDGESIEITNGVVRNDGSGL